MKHFLLRLTLLGLLLSACISQPAPTPTAAPPTSTHPPASPTVTPLPTFMPQPTGTMTPARTATQIQPPDPTATVYPTADSSLPLSKTGPWLAYLSGRKNERKNVAFVNPDGSGRGQLSVDALEITGSPASPYLAVRIPQPDYKGYPGAEAIEIVHLPDMKVVKTISLVTYPEIETFDYSQIKKYYTKKEMIELLVVATNEGGPSWSPNGRYLAFTAAIDGPTSDLYIYDVALDQIRRLTDGLEMAVVPEWSQNGKWIVHRGIGGLGMGCYETGVWAAAVDGSEVKWINRGECFEITRWVGPETFETFVQGVNGGYYGPERQIDIGAGTSVILVPYELGMKGYTDAMHDCVTWKKLTPPRPYNGTRIDSPDQKWFVVIEDGLHLFASDGKLVAEFEKWLYFGGWQPDSSAIVFTSRGESFDQRIIYYYRPADRTLKTFVKETAEQGYDQVIWDIHSASFFIQVSWAPELDYIDPLKGQFLQVSGGLDKIKPEQFAWVGAPTTVSKSVSIITRVNCYYDR